jgi:hypothetical protein
MAVEGGGPSKGYGDGVELGVTAGLCGAVAPGELRGGGDAVVRCGSGPPEHPIHTIHPTDTRTHANRAIVAENLNTKTRRQEEVIHCFPVFLRILRITAKTDNTADATMRNVKVHDLYIHDTGSEGIYFGSTQAQPQHAFEKLEIYDNRFVRTGTEALQTGQLGADCEVHHNVLGPGAVRWRSAFQMYQDGNVQYGQRYGTSTFHHNIVIGTGDLVVELFPTPVSGDPRSPSDTVTFSDNYFADTSASGVYTHAEDTGVTIVFGVGSNSPDPHVLRDNTADAPYPFIKWTFPSVTEANNVIGEVPRVRFRDFMGDAIDENYRSLEWWTDRATLGPGQPVVVYPKGSFVVHKGTLYEASSENQQKPPDANPDVWKALPAPADDVRLRADSPHKGLGIRWPPPS